MKAMVLAAGAGSRMGDLTRDVPKPMLMVQGRPILEHILRNLGRHGFTEIVLNLHHHPQVIQDHFGDGSFLGLSLTYLHEPGLLGTAGSARNAAHLLQGSEPFLLHYGDVLTDQDLGAMVAAHRQKHARATLLLHQRANSNSVVVVDGELRITQLLERPTQAERAGVQSPWVNSGVYLLEPSVLQSLDPGIPLDFPRDVFPNLIEEGRVFGYPLTGYRCAIDSPDRLERARAEWGGLPSS
jgi:mannose-1-phosphate guanylyltransferase/phosphomannomutase